MMNDGTSLLRSEQANENPFLAFQPITIAPEVPAPGAPNFSDDEVEPPETSSRRSRKLPTNKPTRTPGSALGRPISRSKSGNTSNPKSIRSPRLFKEAGAAGSKSSTSSSASADPFALDHDWITSPTTQQPQRTAKPTNPPTNSNEEDFLFGDFMQLPQTTNAPSHSSLTTPTMTSNPFEEITSNPFEEISDPFQAFDNSTNIFEPIGIAGAPVSTAAPPQPTRTNSRRGKRRHTAPVGSIDSAVAKLREDNAKENGHKPPTTSVNGRRARVEGDESSDDDLDVPVVSPKTAAKQKKVQRKRRNSEPVKPQLFDCIAELHRGTALLKYGRRGYPHFRQFQLSADNTKIQWFSKKKGIAESAIDLQEINEVRTGQTTPEFDRVGWTSLAPASFSIVYSNRTRRLSLVAKSVDEQKMWVEALRTLRDKARKGENMSEVESVNVHVDYRDRNRPQSRKHSGKFVRGHETNDRNVDNLLHKKLISDVGLLRERFRNVASQANHPQLTSSSEIESIRQILSELEERLEELEHEVRHTRDTKIAENDVWRTKVDLEALEEKIQVLIRPKRRWSIKRM